MSILIERPGILTTVQDTGRFGYRRFGINPGGVMDTAAAGLINILLGNSENTNVLEMHFPAPAIVFETDTVAAIGGAEFAPRLDGAPIVTWHSFKAPAGSKLTFHRKKIGNRAYLAVRGGFSADDWLGSSSTDLKVLRGGHLGRRFVAGDRITFSNTTEIGNLPNGLGVSPWAVPRYTSSPVLRVLPGAEFERITRSGRKRFIGERFTISRASDRMGFRLVGEPIKATDASELLSTAVTFGTIQLLPHGQMIILMADHQTTGGYPRLGHIISCDLPLVAQLGPDDEVSFQLVSIDEAEAAIHARERELNFLRAGCKLLANIP